MLWSGVVYQNTHTNSHTRTNTNLKGCLQGKNSHDNLSLHLQTSGSTSFYNTTNILIILNSLDKKN